MSLPFTLHVQACPLVVSLVEEHMAIVVREAVAVNRHCKRARQHQDDSEDGKATSTSNNNNNNRPMIRRRLHAADVNMALQLLKTEQLYATGVVPPNPNDATTKVSLKEFLQAESAERMPLPPSEVGIRKHWLAVDGKQPQIPQNPSLLMETIDIDAAAAETTHLTETIALADGSSSVGPVQVQRLQSSLLSEELLLYYIRLTTSMEGGGATASSRHEQDAVLTSVAQDAGLQELVPFIIRYCQQELYKHAQTNVDHCRTLIRLAQCLLNNVHLHLELYLHELLPALMTCAVSKRGFDPTVAANSNHWALRRESASVLVQACQVFGQEYVTLMARVLKALCDAATPTNESLASRYGGMIGITLFGAKAVDAFLLPSLLQSWRDWEAALIKHLDLQPELKFTVQMCQRAALDALAAFLKSLADGTLEDDEDADETVQRLNWYELQDTLGDQCVPVYGYSTEYTSCFV